MKQNIVLQSTVAKTTCFGQRPCLVNGLSFSKAPKHYNLGNRLYRELIGCCYSLYARAGTFAALLLWVALCLGLMCFDICFASALVLWGTADA